MKILFGTKATKFENKKVSRISKFIEKPNQSRAKKIIKQKGYWNSGMFLLRKDSIIYNFKKHQIKTYNNCIQAFTKSKHKNNVHYLNKQEFSKIKAESFDRAVLEKTKRINAIKLDILWSDLGSWKEICNMYNKHKRRYINKKKYFL